MTLGSLFAGVAGFDLGFERNGVTTRWQCEIDENCQKVLAKHYPDAVKYRDVCAMNGAEVEPVDIITFGSPCQDVSIAGKRAGMAGSRSNLFFEAIRIIKEMRQAHGKPDFVVFENVPGLLSMNNGNDFISVLNSFNDLSYSVNCDILDAQNYGVAQRRKRVFILCQHASHLLNTKTITSSITIAQFLTEILQLILIGHCGQLGTVPLVSDCTKTTYEDGLRKRMKLFDPATTLNQFALLLKFLEDESVRCQQGQKTLGLNREYEGKQRNFADTQSDNMLNKKTGSGLEYWNTQLSWKNILEDIFEEANLYTTSAEIKLTTEYKIYTFAKTLLHIADVISPLKHCCPSYYSAELSILTSMKEYINYAKQASNSLFTPMEWVCRWRDITDRLTCACEAVADFAGERSYPILFEREGLRGDIAAGRTAGQSDTGTLAGGAGK